MANERLIPINQFSRPGTKRNYTRNVCFHYTANPGATAENHFGYFGKTLANQDPFDSKTDTYASAHVFIDRVQTLVIIPLDEVAYHASQANPYSIGIELCIEQDGSFHPDTIKQAIEFGAWVAKEYNLSPLTDFIRHYDVTGKICPKPWVDVPADWEAFKLAVNKTLKGVVEVTPTLDKGVGLTILRTWIKPAWEEAKAAGDTAQCDYIAYLGQELRKAAGIAPDED